MKLRSKSIACMMIFTMIIGLFGVVSINADASDSEKTVAIFRLYNPNSGEHFYTPSQEERDYLICSGWKGEKYGWMSPVSSDSPVYRLYNPYSGDHHYTMDEGERDYLSQTGWNYEGIGWYSDDAKSVPLYRQFNPNEIIGAHNYTTSLEENDWLCSTGWQAEGIGWYGVDATFPEYPEEPANFGLFDGIKYWNAGKGAFSSEMSINTDGTFTRRSSGVSAIGYDLHPQADLIFWCVESTGKLCNLTKIDEYTYKATIESIEYKTGGEYNGTTYYEYASDIVKAGDAIYFYMPGKKSSEVIENYFDFLPSYKNNYDKETLDFHGAIILEADSSSVSPDCVYCELPDN